MIFNKHLELKGKHALFSPSQPSWLRYDPEKLGDRLYSQYAAIVGTTIHEYAAMQITLKHRVTSKSQLISGIENYIYQKYYDEKKGELATVAVPILMIAPQTIDIVYDTIKNYINDGIGFRMIPEQVLMFSEEFFGTADTIVFWDNTLRIHDLKTGVSGEMEQLEIYAALFCLEYDVKPMDIQMELRLYKQNEVLIHKPTVEDIVPIMDIIVSDAKMIKETKERGGWK